MEHAFDRGALLGVRLADDCKRLLDQLALGSVEEDPVVVQPARASCGSLSNERPASEFFHGRIPDEGKHRQILRPNTGKDAPARVGQHLRGDFIRLQAG
jgi:hypothetical protein